MTAGRASELRADPLIRLPTGGRQRLLRRERVDRLFEVVSRRYEHKSIVITTNLAFSDWPDIFPNASCVTALIDRLTHHAEICLIEDESYRHREAEETRNARWPAGKKK